MFKSSTTVETLMTSPARGGKRGGRKGREPLDIVEFKPARDLETPCDMGPDGIPVPSEHRICMIMHEIEDGPYSYNNSKCANFRVGRTVHLQIYKTLTTALKSVDMKDIADWHALLDQIVAQGVRLDDLAARTGMSPGTVSRWVNGISTPVVSARKGILTDALAALAHEAEEGRLMAFREFDESGKLKPVTPRKSRDEVLNGPKVVPMRRRVEAN